MIIQCESCSRKFVVNDEDIPVSGRKVKCGYCSVTWHQMPAVQETKIRKPLEKIKVVTENDETPSIDKIKASDGKNYRFLGNQWAQVLPSGKTGLFARKKISKELDEITGRKERKSIKKRSKKIEEVNPSSEILSNEGIIDDNKTKKGIGLLGYIFLLIILGFSSVGILKTFESDIISFFPETAYLYITLEEQLLYIAETVKNIFVMGKDLIESY
tara:strand:- start:1472 stop:2116 length:645 start_codon:yes stop_codon:yes gene_type:complete